MGTDVNNTPNKVCCESDVIYFIIKKEFAYKLTYVVVERL